MKTWYKFHPLVGATLKVAFESNFLPQEILGIDERYSRFGMIYKNHSVQRIYEPALEIVGSFETDTAVQIFFEPISPEPQYRRLVFAKKTGKRNWMLAGRHGEEKVFGFNAENSRDEHYLPLAYPGLTGEFIPVYFKIRKNGDPGFIYLEVWAWDEDKKTTIQARRVDEAEAPGHLISAEPVI